MTYHRIQPTYFFRAAFKFGRRVHFALRRQMLKLPIARLPAILLYFIYRPSGETDVFMKQPSSEHRHGPARLHLTSIQNTNEENGRSS